MGLKAITKKILGINKSSHKMSLEYWEKNGFIHGKNFQFNGDSAIDSNYPWLITIGDNVTLASDVRILAHDASTAKIGGGYILRLELSKLEITFLLAPILLYYAM